MCPSTMPHLATYAKHLTTIDIDVQLTGANTDSRRTNNGNYVDLIPHCF
jgi:hypothetical protein